MRCLFPKFESSCFLLIPVYFLLKEEIQLLHSFQHGRLFLIGQTAGDGANHAEMKVSVRGIGSVSYTHLAVYKRQP